jgi:hypothetical protein
MRGEFIRKNKIKKKKNPTTTAITTMRGTYPQFHFATTFPPMNPTTKKKKKEKP